MEEEKISLINEICEEQNFEVVLLDILKQNSENRINELFENIEENNKIDIEIKKQIYEELLEYIDEVNINLQTKIKEIFILGIRETIKKLNYSCNKQLWTGKAKEMEKIKIIIADDNKEICRIIERSLKQHNDIEILGIANTDEEEIQMIETLKPEIVITDLVRKHKYTGLEIIKNYSSNKRNPAFLVISADRKIDVINNGVEVAGYIQKPFFNYEEVYTELRRIKEKLNYKKYL